MLTLFDYANELLELNKEPLQTWDKQRFYSSVAFGLVEELLEFLLAFYEPHVDKWRTGVVKEAGDVLAYVVLVLASSTDEWEFNAKTISRWVSKVYESNHSQQYTDVLTAAQTMAGLFKRYFREQQEVSSSAVAMCLNTVLSELTPHGITLADIAEANLKKLKDRANRGQLFQGTGSDR